MAAVQKLFPYTPRAPIRQGIYSQAVVVDRTMYISGQLGLDVASGKLVEGGVQAQARQTSLLLYLPVVKTTVLLADMNDFVNVSDVYKIFFSKNFPARAAYQVVALPRVRTITTQLYPSPESAP
uniref:Uncharacterized protein n=1 Tax=Salmo trutta TaxID=8032 RepID=A0A674CE64_SALTR